MLDSSALAMMEFKSIGLGLKAVDWLIKAYPVELVLVRVVCPGKLLAAVSGEVAAVRAGLEYAAARPEWNHIDSFCLGNPHPNLISAVKGTTPVGQLQALGILETYSASSAVLAADTAVKAAQVELYTIRLAGGISGRGCLYLGGTIGAVTAAVDAVLKTLSGELLVDSRILANPSPQAWDGVFVFGGHSSACTTTEGCFG